MAAVSVGGGVGGATGDQGSDAVAVAFQQMAQGLAGIQEAMRQQEQRVQEMEAKMARAEGAVEALTQRVDEGLRRLEERGETVEQPLPLAGQRKRVQRAGRVESKDQLESRMQKLEASLERALETVFPRVEALVAQLEKPSPPAAPPAPTSTSAAAPSSSAASTSRSPSPPRRRLRTTSPSPSRPSTSSDPLLPGSPVRRATLDGDLLNAAVGGSVEDVRWFLDAGADINYSDWYGMTPTMRAALNGHVDVVALLLERGPDLSATCVSGMTALHCAASSFGAGRCVSLLIDAGAVVDARDNLGRTPLHEAALGETKVAVRVLLRAGANRNLRDKNGRTPFFKATTVDSNATTVDLLPRLRPRRRPRE